MKEFPRPVNNAKQNKTKHSHQQPLPCDGKGKGNNWLKTQTQINSKQHVFLKHQPTCLSISSLGKRVFPRKGFLSISSPLRCAMNKALDCVIFDHSSGVGRGHGALCCKGEARGGLWNHSRRRLSKQRGRRWRPVAPRLNATWGGVWYLQEHAQKLHYLIFFFATE